MLKKAFRWLLITLIVLILLVIIAGAGIYYYVNQNQYGAVREAAEQLGLEVTYAKAKPTFWTTFPKISLRVDSLTIRDLNRTESEPDLIYAETLSAGFSLKKMWQDTLVWEELSLCNSSIYLASDSAGVYNLGKLIGAKDTVSREENLQKPSLLNPIIDLSGVAVNLEQVRVAYFDPPKHKRMEVRFDSAEVLAEVLSPTQVHFTACMETSIKGLSFNTDKGSYLKNSVLSGCLAATLQDATWMLDATNLHIGPDEYEMSGMVGPQGLQLHIVNDSLDYERARAMLHDTLQVRLKEYNVEGPFSVSADIYNQPGGGNDVDLSIRFTTRNQSVRLKAFQFHQVSTNGVFVNRMPVDIGGTQESTTEFTIYTDTTIATYDGMLITSPKALVRGWPTDTYLDSPINLKGAAAALARLFGNTDFQFDRGRFVMNTDVSASLNRVDEIINSSDGDLTLRDFQITYLPSSVSFPMQLIRLKKTGKDVDFRLESGAVTNSLKFDMVGRLDNILPLLMDRPADSLKTDVIFHAERGDWSSFRNIFGEDGYFTTEQSQLELSQDEQVRKMKQTLLGLGEKFRPHLQMVIDTLAYYDVITLLDFRAGLKFDRDTLVLEKSRFDWEDGTVQLKAKVNLNELNQTPFSVGIGAEAIDLNALRKPLRSFGLRLPTGLNRLPDNLDIEFAHQGIINDSFGIQPGNNYGHLDFRDGKNGLFEGSIAYSPGADALETKLLLSGDPVIVNDLFAAQDFFFGTGHFNIDLNIIGQPGSLEELMTQSDLRLVIDSSKVSYRPSGVFVPLDQMVVNAIGDETTFHLALSADSTRRLVTLTGVMDRLSAFLYPKESKPFNLNADVEAELLQLSDIFDFIQVDTESGVDSLLAAPGIAKDTAGFDPQLLLSTTEGIFDAFHPEVRLQIDTFQVDPVTQFTDLRAGIRLLDSTLLIVDNTGFTLGEGVIDLSATYSLDQENTSPFTLQWEGHNLSLQGLEKTIQRLNINQGAVDHHLKGTVSSAGDVRGVINETSWQLPYEKVSGVLHFRIEGGELVNLPLLKEIGRKARMRKRFKEIFLGPLELFVAVESGRMTVPLTEIQSTAVQFFIEGHYDTLRGPDVLISIPLRNIGRGVLTSPPPPTGYALAGRKIYLVVEPDELSGTAVRFRLGRRKYYRERGTLEELKRLKLEEKEERKEARRKRRINRKMD